MQVADDDASTRMPSTPDREPLWKRCLDFDRQDAGHYNDYVQEPLFQLIDGEPKRVLDLGCAAAAFGAAVRQRFPGASVVGIEAGHAAAAKAQSRLDRVIRARLEDVSFADEGMVSSILQGGRFDYDERGLLDITHLRFFTLGGVRRLFEETGYVLERDMAIILPSLESVRRNYRGADRRSSSSAE